MFKMFKPIIQHTLLNNGALLRINFIASGDNIRI